jgi:uncharacterized protein
MNHYPPTAGTEVRRLPTRGRYAKSDVHAILDAGRVCHVGFVHEGQPFVIPTLYARAEETVYVHGSAASRMVRTLSGGADVCLTVTLLDGLVLARSAFHHSVNYRSVMVFGKARLVDDPAEKMEALRRITDHVVPGRWKEVRPPDDTELKATTVLAVKLETLSAKVRTGPPVDDEADYALPVWAGVVPVGDAYGEPVADGRVLPGVPVFETARLENRK